MNMQQALNNITKNIELTQPQMEDVMRTIMNGEATDAQIGALMMGLRLKGESIDEITAAARVMREFAIKIDVSDVPYLVDIVGTGGDGQNLFNVSTASAFDLNMQQTERCIREMGVGFLFAPNHHKAMKYAVGPRRELGIRSIFNLLGPLTNPAGVKRLVIGVFSTELCRPIAEVMKQLGAEHVMVVHSKDGLDEISLASSTYVAELKNGEVTEWEIQPEDVGIESQTLTGLIIQDSAESLSLIKDALGKNKSDKGEKAANMIALNAGAGLYVSGLCTSYKQGVALAHDIIYGGQALEKMSILAEFSKTLKQYDA